MKLDMEKVWKKKEMKDAELKLRQRELELREFSNNVWPRSAKCRHLCRSRCSK